MSEENENQNDEVEKNDGEIIDNDGESVDLDSLDEDGKKKDDEEEQERPEWLDERFKNPEDLAKSYKELEKKLQEKGMTAPDEYEISDDFKEVKFDNDNIDALKEFAKEKNWNNDTFNQALDAANQLGLLEVPDYEKEMAALGDKKDAIISSLESYKGKLSKEEAEVMENMVFTADQAKLLHKIIRSHNPTNIPSKAGGKSSAGGEKKDMQKELNTLMSHKDIRTDRNLQQKAEELATAIAEYDQ